MIFFNKKLKDKKRALKVNKRRYIMIKYLNELEEDRMRLLLETEHLTPEQYNQIPAGFNNNIIWNLGHIILVGEGMLYKNSPSLRPVLELDRSLYGKGSKPETFVNADEITRIRELMLRSLRSYKIAAGLDRSTDSPAPDLNVGIIGEAGVQFLLFHEHMHYRKISVLIQNLSK